MSGIVFEITVKDEIKKVLKRTAENIKDLNPLLNDFGERMLRSVNKNFMSGGRPGWKPSKKSSGKTLMGNPPRLKNSINYKVVNGELKIGTNVIYGRIHQRGGIIKPKKAKMLAIPLKKIAENKSPREFKDTFIRKSKKGNLIIFQKRGNTSAALYILKKFVKIPARPYLLVQPEDERYFKKSLTRYLMG